MKFYDSMLFLKEEQKTTTNTKNVFTVEQRETLITFYQNRPALRNHGLNGYRDRNLRRVLLCKLVKAFEDKFSEEDKTILENQGLGSMTYSVLRGNISIR